MKSPVVPYMNKCVTKASLQKQTFLCKANVHTVELTPFLMYTPYSKGKNTIQALERLSSKNCQGANLSFFHFGVQVLLSVNTPVTSTGNIDHLAWDYTGVTDIPINFICVLIASHIAE